MYFIKICSYITRFLFFCVCKIRAYVTWASDKYQADQICSKLAISCSALDSIHNKQMKTRCSENKTLWERLASAQQRRQHSISILLGFNHQENKLPLKQSPTSTDLTQVGTLSYALSGQLRPSVRRCTRKDPVRRCRRNGLNPQACHDILVGVTHSVSIQNAVNCSWSKFKKFISCCSLSHASFIGQSYQHFVWFYSNSMKVAFLRF